MVTFRQWLQRENMICAVATVTFDLPDPMLADHVPYKQIKLMISPAGDRFISGRGPLVDWDTEMKNVKWDYCDATVWCENGWWDYTYTGDYYCDGWHFHPNPPEQPKEWKLEPGEQ